MINTLGLRERIINKASRNKATKNNIVMSAIHTLMDKPAHFFYVFWSIASARRASDSKGKF
jgi:hypothetical protein